MGIKDSALGDARSHFTLCRVFTFEDYFLGTTGEKVCNPRQSITSHSSKLKLMPPSSRRTSMPCKTGKVPGRCHLIPTSVRYYASPTSVINVNEKKQGTNDSALGDARSHFTLCRMFTFEVYFLGATGEKVCNPRQSITSHRHCPWSPAFSRLHKRHATLCLIESKTICGRLPPI
jgi:hypothetical protein